MASNKKLAPAKARKPAKLKKPAIDTTCFPFECLAAELRNKIYAEYLVYDRPILIYRPKTRPLGRGKLRSAVWVPASPPVTGNNSQSKPTRVSRANILCLNKNIHAEATPIMYGANTFRFDSLPDMKQALQTMGEQVQYIRHVKLGFWNRTNTHEGLELLRDAEHIETLIVLLRKCDTRAIQDVHKGMMKGLRRFVDHGETYAQRRHRFTSIKFGFQNPRQVRSLTSETGDKFADKETALRYIKRSFETALVKEGTLLPVTETS